MDKSCIYKITSPSGKVYIGQTKNTRTRWSAHRRGSFGCTKLYYSIKKYGADQHLFSVIQEIPKDADQKVFDIYEDYYIQQYKSCGVELLNLKGDKIMGKHSDETKEKFKIVFKGRKLRQETKDRIGAAHKGMKRPEGTGEKISRSQIGKKRSDETKAKQRELKLGKPLSDSHKKSLSIALSGKGNPFYGKKHSAETLKKIQESRAGYVVSEETKEKMSRSQKGKTLGYKRSEETKKRISLATMGRTWTEERKAKFSASQKGKKMPRSAIEKMMKKRLQNGSYKKLNQCLTV